MIALCWYLLLTAPEVGTTARALADPFIEQHPQVGLVIGVVTPDGSHVFGYGRVELGGERVTPAGDTVFEIGSVSKVFTGVLLADMIHDGTVQPDDPVKEYLPDDWVLPRRDGRDIRLIHLTTHTSGLPVQPPALPLFALTKDPANPYAEFGEGHLRQTLGAIKLRRPIGSRHEYSNLGTGLLGEALYRAAKADSFEALLAARICEPLGLADTRITLGESQRERLAPPHDGGGEPTSPWDFACLHACGAIRSTANDLLAFLQANLEPSEAIAMTHLPWREILPGKQSVGFGWFREEPRDGNPLLIWHNGGTGGYASFVGFLPDSGHGVVVLANAAEREVDSIGMELLRTLSREDY